MDSLIFGGQGHIVDARFARGVKNRGYCLGIGLVVSLDNDGAFFGFSACSRSILARTERMSIRRLSIQISLVALIAIRIFTFSLGWRWTLPGD